jgi:predicted dehydrogenase
MEPTRREFLKAAAAGIALTGTRSLASPNERITLAVLGIHGRGAYLAENFSEIPNVEVGFLADPDSRLFDEVAKKVESVSGKRPETIQDFRPFLDNKDIDAIVIATPDHWHALATIWACEAGKDVYVEKPVSHNIGEGRRMVEAARKHDRIVQVGLQRRSAPFLPEAREYIRSGKLGGVHMARIWHTSKRPPIGKEADCPAPEGVDYNLWLGPAPERPFNPNRFHYEWHWHWDYGTGELGNNGVHGVDLARALLDFGHPKRIACIGGMHEFEDDHETPDTQIVLWDYPGLSVICEERMWGGLPLEGGTFGVAVYGTEGTLLSDGESWETRHGDEIQKFPSSSGIDEHLAGFIESVRTRKAPIADIEEGHLSTLLCHTGNIAYRLGRDLRFDAESETFIDDAEANGFLARIDRDLG